MFDEILAVQVERLVRVAAVGGTFEQVVAFPLDLGAVVDGVVLDGDTLYTMCRRGDKDAVLAISANTGETVWETPYDAPTKKGMDLEYGSGPHSTPLVVGDRIFTVGAMVQLHCLDKKTGKIPWSHDLMAEMGASHLHRGYGASPLAYEDTVILNVGPSRRNPGPGLAAFKQEIGELVWKSEAFGPGNSSPILARINGEDHLVAALGGDRAGLDPATGKTKWRTTVDSQSFGVMALDLSPAGMKPGIKEARR
ncbi:MAG: PQQ-binding-like beta-propeller repeat protein [Phycisphaerae bacterium]|nr:PQQ-binding-like beta-propeller repeat protein [Phycisphaerae bacterium]